MEAICSSDMSVDFRRTIRRYIPEDITLHSHRCDNLKSNIVGLAEWKTPLWKSRCRWKILLKLYVHVRLYGLRVWNWSIWLGIGSCEHGNKPWDSIQGRKLTGHLSDYQFLKKNSTPPRHSYPNICMVSVRTADLRGQNRTGSPGIWSSNNNQSTATVRLYIRRAGQWKWNSNDRWIKKMRCKQFPIILRA
jgi:hypothetical protein